MPENIKHIYQPTGNSCGPTCLKMVADALLPEVPSIEELCVLCGTDWVEGTPPEKMKLGLGGLGLSYKVHTNEEQPYRTLAIVLKSGSIAILRTITHGVPHWIVVYGLHGEHFLVYDPTLGELTYSQEELESIWRVRDYYFFEIKKVLIRSVREDDLTIIKPRLAEVFKSTDLLSESIWGMISHYEPELSVVAESGGEVVGFYFLGSQSIPPYGPDYEVLKDLKGIEGLALGVFKEFRRFGIGRRLINYPSTIKGIDYIWGYQLRLLNNREHWLKRRKIYEESDSVITTYQLFN